MARRVRMIQPTSTEDLITEALIEHDEDELGVDLIKTVLSSFDAAAADDPLTVSIALSTGAGKWNIVDTWRGTVKTFDIDNLVEKIQQDQGNGEYKFVLRHNGRILKQTTVGIGNPRKPQGMFGGADGQLLPALLKRALDGGDKSNDMATLLPVIMQMQTASQAQTTQLMAQMMQSQTAMMTAIFGSMSGNKESATDLLGKLVTMNREMHPEKTSSITETIEVLKAVKDMMPEGAGEGDMLSNLLKHAPGLLEGASKFLPQPGQPAFVMPASAQPPPMDLSQLSDARTIAPTVNLGVTDPGYKSHRVLDLIREDILFYAKKQLSYELAGDGLLEILERNHVTQNDIVSLATEFQVANWLDNLAGYGIDLRQWPVWANQLLSYVVQSYLQPDINGGNPAGDGPEGSGTDTSTDGGPI